MKAPKIRGNPRLINTPRGRLARMTVPGVMTDEALIAEMEALMSHEDTLARRWECDRDDCDGMPHAGWLHRHARAKQRTPSGRWWLWLVMTGRGWGKTRTASETVKKWVQEPDTVVAVVARKMSLVRKVCFEARRAGLLAVIDPAEVLSYTHGSDVVTLRLRNGSVIYGYSAQVPDNFRGEAFDKVWCDEYAAWPQHVAQETWDVLTFCLRDSPDPQRVVTTTPRGNKHMKALLAQAKRSIEKDYSEAPEAAPEEDTEGDKQARAGRVPVLTTGSMLENSANLNEDFIDEAQGTYEGTRFGQQEIDGVLLDDVEGALWTTSTFDYSGEGGLDFRLAQTMVPPLARTIVAMDPSTTNKETSDGYGIVVAGRSAHVNVSWRDLLPSAFVFHAEEDRATPRAQAQRAVDLYWAWGAEAVVVETNNGGDWIPTVIQMIDPRVNVEVITAHRDKRTRATPVATFYEREKVHHVGPAARFATLEGQMTTFVGREDTKEASPNLLDALVWAITDLLTSEQTARQFTNVIDTRGGRR